MPAAQPAAYQPRPGDMVVYHGSVARYSGWEFEVREIVHGRVHLQDEVCGVRLTVRPTSIKPRL